MLHFFSLLPLYLAFFILYIYSFYDFRKQQKKESLSGLPRFFLTFWDSNLGFGLAYREIGGGGGLGRGGFYYEMEWIFFYRQ